MISEIVCYYIDLPSESAQEDIEAYILERANGFYDATHALRTVIGNTLEEIEINLELK
jgi:hypothetical protein